MDKGIGVDQILKSYFKNIADCKISPFGSGLIHRTFFLQHAEGDFILQKINHQVFKDPALVMQNIQMVSQHLNQNNYPKTILEIRKTLDGKLLFQNQENEFWRIFKYISDTQYFSKAISEKQVFETGCSFGEFLFFLKDLSAEKIQPAIPNFHNITFRLKNFEKAVEKDSFDRVKNCLPLIHKIQSKKILDEDISQIHFPTRIVHADPKINNLLFDKNKNVKAVIDWDTIMPGKIVFDFGDLVRTMCCTEDENSTDFSKVKISKQYLVALRKGFLEKTNGFLVDIEKEYLMLGAKVIIYEQAVRFLTDYLEGDGYYLTEYEGQNLDRGKNQMRLLESLEEVDF